MTNTVEGRHGSIQPEFASCQSSFPRCGHAYMHGQLGCLACGARFVLTTDANNIVNGRAFEEDPFGPMVDAKHQGSHFSQGGSAAQGPPTGDVVDDAKLLNDLAVAEAV